MPLRVASAMRSQRGRTRLDVGRNERSNSRERSTVPTIESSGIVWSPSCLSPRRPSACTTSSKGRITSTSLGSRRSAAATRARARRRRARPKSNCASAWGSPVSRGMPPRYPSQRRLPANIRRVTTAARTPRLTAVRRSEERVTPLELFFDLVFVLAITQCTALMAKRRRDLERAGQGPARAWRDVVVVGRLRLADQRRRPRGGRRPVRDVRRDGGAAGRRALRAGVVRRLARAVRLRLRRRPLRADRAVRAREPRRACICATRSGASPAARRSAPRC